MTQGGARDQRRLCVYTAGFWRGPRLSRILTLAGWQLALGLPGPGDAVGVWGASPHAWRGAAIARRRGAPLLRIEDAFLRSVVPGRARGALARRGPVGLLIDPLGVHFDPASPSLIESLVTSGAAAARAAEAEAMIARLRAADLSKYNAHDPAARPPLGPGYVLVIDQTRGDAALRGADAALFRAMLAAARDENPGRPVLIRTHPETAAGLRAGHLGAGDLRAGDAICDGPVSPWRLVGDAGRVYSVSSQLGYEALLAGHRPRLFGQPFYAGWGLSDDQPGGTDLSRRGAATAAQLFAASHLIAPVWYDPCRDALCDCEGAVRQLEAEAQAFRQDRGGHLAYGMRLWKRAGIAGAFGQGGTVCFARRPSDEVTLVWANRADEVLAARGAGDGAATADAPPRAPLLRVEDGFVRSRGLGAALTPALSLVADDLGIYYDPSRPSRLEALIAAPLPPGGAARAAALIARLRAEGTSKYNLPGAAALPDLPRRHDGQRVILVPGQVEDDASIRLGAGDVRTNLGLLAAVRAAAPDALIVWKPHPDVEAGLRPGAVDPQALSGLADITAAGADPAALLARVDAVWTMTSTLGFEALIRGVPVVCLGAPFYAGWGLTRDLGPIPARRLALAQAMPAPPAADPVPGQAPPPGLARLVHAALIAYPRYRDPRTGLPCPVEVALDRLAAAQAPQGGPALRLLAKAQGALASRASLWR